MRAPSRPRLLLRDAAATCAFGAMAISGQLPLPALLAVGLGFLCALGGWRPFRPRGGWSVALLALAALLLGWTAWSGLLDVVVAACTFAGVLTAQRALSRPGADTDPQVLLGSLLMVAGGAALSGDLLFAPLLFLFAACALLSLGLGVVEDSTPEGEPVPTRAVLRPMALGILFACVASVGLFLFIPRFSWNVVGRRVSPGLGAATTGFSETVRLGGTGTIKTNPRLVLRAELSPDPGVERLEAYWVGRTFDTFDGVEWTGVGEPRPAGDEVRLGPGGEGLVHQKIELLPAYDARTLVALESPSLLGRATAHSPQGSRRTSLTLLPGEEVRFATRAVGYSYHAYSVPPGSSPNRPRPAPDADALALALALPQSLDPRVGQLAARVLGEVREPLAAAEKLAAFLRREYGYTLELPGESEDPLADFLFERREGHCEHFATALAVLLRTQGIPTRVAAGFFGGERVEGQYVVRAGDAHAWTQVLVPGRGWVSVDATPPAFRVAQPLQLLAWLTSAYEKVDTYWRNQVVDYSFRDQLGFVRTLFPPSPRRAARSEAPPTRTPPTAWWVAAVVGLAVYAVWRLSLRPRPQHHPATWLHEALERTVRQAPLGRLPEEPLEELARRLEAGGHPLGPALGRATRRYLEARFGGRPLSAAEGRTLLEGVEAGVRGLPRPPARSAAQG